MLDQTTIKTIVDNEPAKNSAGYFVELMTSFNRYISEEYKQNRLTGAQYAEVYLGGMQANLQAAMEYAKHQDAQNLQEQLAQEQLAKQDEWKIAELSLQEQLAENQLAQQKELTDLQRLQDKTVADAQLAQQKELTNLQRTQDKTIADAQLAKQDEWKIAEHDLQQQKIDLESALNVTQQALIQAQTQAFRAKHNKEMAKLVFDVVTIGVTQEQMNVLSGPNAVFGGITPSAAYQNAQWS